MKLRIVSDDDRALLADEWDALVAKNASAGIMQTYAWSRFKQRQGLNLLHLGLFEERTLTGGAIFYCIPQNFGTGILVAPEGPILPWEDQLKTADALKLLMDGAAEYAREHGMVSMRIEPRLSPPLSRVFREFGRAPYDLIPKETLQVDLSAPEEIILERMKSKGRYNIKLAERHGVRVVESTAPEAVYKFYPLVKEASLRDGFALEPLMFFEHLSDELVSSKHASFFFAEHENDIVGALLLVTCGERATYLYGGIANQKRQLMGGYALQWEAIKAAKRKGCQIYDFYGFDSFQSPRNEYARFSQFKSRFGGEVHRLIGAQEHFFVDCLADAFIKIVNGSAMSQTKSTTASAILHTTREIS